jgi:hypothetical protein
MSANVPAVSRSWDELVTDGRRILAATSRCTWALADLAVEVAPPLPPNTAERDAAGRFTSRHAAERLRRFAADVGDESARTLANMRTVAIAWPASRRRDAVSFGVHAALAAAPGRDALLALAEARHWTVRDAREAVRHVADHALRAAFERDLARYVPGKPVPLEEVEQIAVVVDLGQALARFDFALDGVAAKWWGVSRLDDEQRTRARAFLDRTRARLDRLEEALDLELVEVDVDDLDDELRELLAGTEESPP